MESQAFLTTFEVVVEGNEEPISGVLPDTAQVIGAPLFISATDADTGQRTFAVGASGVNKMDKPFAGLIMRASQLVATAIGSTANNLLFGLAETGGALDTPYQVSKPGSVKRYKEIVVEGTDYLDVATSNYAISSTTAVGTQLTFHTGKWAVCYDTTDDFVYGRLMAQLTPITAGNVRIRIQLVEPRNYVVAAGN